MMHTYSLGIDFGTLSARATLWNLVTAQEGISVSVPYVHGVIEDILPSSQEVLPSEFALQHPQDYLSSLIDAVQQVLSVNKTVAGQVVAIGIDATGSTVIPVNKHLVPLALLPEFSTEKHAFPKLWKHHASQPEADLINEALDNKSPGCLDVYGGRQSAEWLFPKALEVFRHAPNVFAATASFIELGDWIVSQLVGTRVTSLQAAGFKAMQPLRNAGIASTELWNFVEPGFGIVEDKVSLVHKFAGERAGDLTQEWAQKLGLNPGTVVAVGNLDAHVAVLGAGVQGPGELVMVMGTSICDLIMTPSYHKIENVSGAIEGGIYPGLWSYELGQAGFGDTFGWFTENFVRKLNPQLSSGAAIDLLETEIFARNLKPTGIIGLDWFNGSREFANSNLRGVLSGLGYSHDIFAMYQGLVESSALGQRDVITRLREGGVPVTRIIACGGVAKNSALIMQIFANVIGQEIEVAASENLPALSAALHGVAALENVPLEQVASRVKDAPVKQKTFTPDSRRAPEYDLIYKKYREVAQSLAKLG